MAKSSAAPAQPHCEVASLVDAIVEVVHGCDPRKEETQLRAWLTKRLTYFTGADKPSAHQALYEALSHAVAVLKSRELDARSVDSVLSTAAAALKLARGE